jgi:hypothetical protein
LIKNSSFNGVMYAIQELRRIVVAVTFADMARFILLTLARPLIYRPSTEPIWLTPQTLSHWLTSHSIVPMLFSFDRPCVLCSL